LRPVVYDATATRSHASIARRPPRAYRRAQDAVVWVDIAVDVIDRDDDAGLQALGEALARRRAVTVFSALAREPGMTGRVTRP
jgi:hypothetical protein